MRKLPAQGNQSSEVREACRRILAAILTPCSSKLVETIKKSELARRLKCRDKGAAISIPGPVVPRWNSIPIRENGRMPFSTLTITS